MSIIDMINIARINLNLLVAFNALYKERHVTRAGERLAISQSAMSSTLNQLRDLFKDELFVRTSKGMLPTEKADELAPKICQALKQIETFVFSCQDFDPTRSTRTFTIGMSDYAELFLLPSLAETLETKAPHVNIRIKHINQLGKIAPFSSGEIDLGIGLFMRESQHLAEEIIFSEPGICAARKDHPVMKGKMTLEKYLSGRHIAIIYQDDSSQTMTDTALRKIGAKRDIAISLPHMLPVLHTLENTDYIGTMPKFMSKFINKKPEFTWKPVPFEMPPCELSMVWDKRNQNNQGLQWLRETIKTLAKTLS